MKRPHSLILIALLLYAVACIVPAMRNQDGEAIPGWVALAGGWVPPMTLPWSANLILVVGLLSYAFGKYGAARIAGLIALGVSITTLTMYRTHQLHVGYLLWEASLIGFTAGAWIATRAADGGTALEVPPDEDHSKRPTGEP